MKINFSTRKLIERRVKEGKTQSEIASEIGVSQVTVSHELKKCNGKDYYEAEKAEAIAKGSRKNKKTYIPGHAFTTLNRARKGILNAMVSKNLPREMLIEMKSWVEDIEKILQPEDTTITLMCFNYQKILDDYLNGRPAEEIGKDYGVSRNKIVRFLKNHADLNKLKKGFDPSATKRKWSKYANENA